MGTLTAKVEKQKELNTGVQEYNNAIERQMLSDIAAANKEGADNLADLEGADIDTNVETPQMKLYKTNADLQRRGVE